MPSPLGSASATDTPRSSRSPLTHPPCRTAAAICRPIGLASGAPRPLSLPHPATHAPTPALFWLPVDWTSDAPHPSRIHPPTHLPYTHTPFPPHLHLHTKPLHSFSQPARTLCFPLCGLLSPGFYVPLLFQHIQLPTMPPPPYPPHPYMEASPHSTCVLRLQTIFHTTATHFCSCRPTRTSPAPPSPCNSFSVQQTAPNSLHTPRAPHCTTRCSSRSPPPPPNPQPAMACDPVFLTQCNPIVGGQPLAAFRWYTICRLPAPLPIAPLHVPVLYSKDAKCANTSVLH